MAMSAGKDTQTSMTSVMDDEDTANAFDEQSENSKEKDQNKELMMSAAKMYMGMPP